MENKNDILCETALEKLKKGNEIFITATSSVGDISLERRKSTFLNGQTPYAVIISCSDSRVMPESIFSAGIGELFVIRVVGNVVDKTVLASMEYAVSHLNVPLVVVLGHTGCGAINSAINRNATGLIKNTIDKIVDAIGDEKDDYLATKKNVTAGVNVVNNIFGEQKINAKVIGAIYFGDSGKVDFLKWKKKDNYEIWL